MAEFLDDVIAQADGKEWQFQALPLPQVGHLSDIEDAITLQQFLSASCRRCDGVKNTTMIFDGHMQVAEYGGLARLGELIQQGQLKNLPPPLCVQGATPSGRKDGGHHPQPPGRHHEHHQAFPIRWVCLRPRSSAQVMSVCLFTNQIRIHTPSESTSNTYCNGCLAFEFCGTSFGKANCSTSVGAVGARR